MHFENKSINFKKLKIDFFFFPIQSFICYVAKYISIKVKKENSKILRINLVILK